MRSFFLEGWQESTDAALTFLLRTSLAKAGKENQGATPISLELATDTTRIKKHISSVIDRVSKGSRISDEKNKLEAPSLVDFKMDSDSDEENEPKNKNDIKNNIINHTPIGTQFGEQGERLRSARVRSAVQPISVKKVEKQDDSKRIENGPDDSTYDAVEIGLIKPTEEELEVEKHIINDDADDDDEDSIW